MQYFGHFLNQEDVNIDLEYISKYAILVVNCTKKMSAVQTCSNNIYFLHQSCFSSDELDLELDVGEQDDGDDGDDEDDGDGGDGQAEGDDTIGDNESDGDDEGGRDDEGGGNSEEGGGDAKDGGSEESDCALGLRGMC